MNFPFDIFLSQLLISLRSPALTQVMLVITFFGSPAIIILSVLFHVWLLVKREYTLMGAFLATQLFTKLVLDEGLKLLVHRARPSWPHLEVATGYSFPSGHVLNSVVFYVLMAVILGRVLQKPQLGRALTIAALVFCLVIALTRVYLGVHYPTDVLGGYLIGLFVSWVFNKCSRPLTPNP